MTFPRFTVEDLLAPVKIGYSSLIWYSMLGAWMLPRVWSGSAADQVSGACMKPAANHTPEGRETMHILRAFILGILVLTSLLVPVSTQAAKGGGGGRAKVTSAPTCKLPESNAEALVILNNYYPGYWWDHTDLTIAVQAHPKATDEQLAA